MDEIHHLKSQIHTHEKQIKWLRTGLMDAYDFIGTTMRGMGQMAVAAKDVASWIDDLQDKVHERRMARTVRGSS